jgi:hypothetical protein
VTSPAISRLPFHFRFGVGSFREVSDPDDSWECPSLGAGLAGSSEFVVDGFGWDVIGRPILVGSRIAATQVLVNWINPEAAFVNLHDIHISVNVNPVSLVRDPNLNQIILGLKQRIQRIDQVDTGLTEICGPRLTRNLLFRIQVIGNVNVKL